MEFKFAYEPKFRLENRTIKRLDNERIELNKLCSIAEYQAIVDNSANLETAGLLKENLLKLGRSLPRINASNLFDFDGVVFQDIKRNYEACKSYYDYMFNFESKMKVRGFISKLYGRGTYTSLMHNLLPENYPHKNLHEFSGIMDSKEGKKLDPDIIFNNGHNPLFNQLRLKFEEKLNSSKHFVNEFYRSKGVLLEVGEYNFEFAPSGNGFSFWNENNLLAAIDPNRLICFKNNSNKYEFFRTFIDLIGVHELGHGLEGILADKTMPSGLRPDWEMYFPPVHGPCAEGVCLALESFALDYLNKNSEKFRLNEDNLKLAELFVKTYVPKKTPQILFGILDVIEIENILNKKVPEGFRVDSNKQLAKITGVKRYLSDPRMMENPSLSEVFSNLGYFAGERRINPLVKKMKKHKIPEDIMISSLLVGTWCDAKAQEKFIFDIYLPEVMKNKK